ncbi:MAG TPA: NUDIX domain-containing protein [Rhodocyclaceae bacterium]|nr:NUDIX domain-containing protein [Rhodocyclaceae bacterium]HMY48256.1 NUDIX domain-containing protein [Rhodocyclaceae bacterium]
MTTPSPDALREAIATLRAALGPAPRDGLPEDLFLFVSSLTPLVNVDLLIRDDAGRMLLGWRHDAFYGPGWHVPGGIIRFREDAATRIAAVAARELGARVRFEPEPLCIHEIVNDVREERGHFISMLYACTLDTPPDERLRFDPSAPVDGAWAWHAACPDPLIDAHDLYRPWLGPRGAPRPTRRSGRQPQRHWHLLSGRPA